jgi:hypothetical protein
MCVTGLVRVGRSTPPASRSMWVISADSWRVGVNVTEGVPALFVAETALARRVRSATMKNRRGLRVNGRARSTFVWERASFLFSARQRGKRMLKLLRGLYGPVPRSHYDEEVEHVET